MRKKTFSTILILVLVGGGIFLFYKKWSSHSITSSWNLIPSDAMMVFETSNAFDYWKHLQETNPGSTLLSISDFKKIASNIEFLDSLSEEYQDLASFLKNKNITASLHVTDRENIGFLFFIPITSKRDETLVQNLLGSFQQSNDFMLEPRSYQGFSLTEITSIKTRKVFSCFRYENYLIGSYYPFLVENVIRIIHSDEKNFTTDHPELNPVSNQSEDLAVYLNLKELHHFVEIFFDSNISDVLPSFFPMGRDAQLALAVQDQYTTATGFSYYQPGEWLSLFDNQQPQSFDSKNLISNRTALTYSMNFNQPMVWKDSLITYWDKKEKDVKQEWKKIKSSDHISIETWLQQMDGDITYSVWGESSDETIPCFLYVKQKEIAKSKEILDRISTRLSISIHQLPIANFPNRVWGNFFPNFENCYYADANNYLIFSNNVNALKQLLNDITNEDTWGKSKDQNRFIENALKESNISVFFNTHQCSSLLQRYAAPTWKKFFRENNSILRAFEHASFQWSYAEGKFYTSFTLSHSGKNEIISTTKKSSSSNFISDLNEEGKKEEENKIENNKQQKQESIAQKENSEKYVQKPIGIRGLGDQELKFLLFDQSNTLSLRSTSDRLIWEKKLESLITTSIQKIQLTNSKSLECVFGTKNKIYIIDKNGKNATHFPVTVTSNENIDHLSVLDYEKDRSYRFAVTTESGNVFLYNIKGEKLEGWSPRAFHGSFIAPIQHFRIGSKDYLLGIQQNGTVQLVNRKGEAYKNFPIRLKKTISPHSFFIEKKSNASESILTILTEDGTFVRMNFEGKILKEKQLEKSSSNQFKLITDAGNSTWVIARISSSTITILSQRATILFEKELKNPSSTSMQYYLFGKEEIFAFTDKKENKTHIVNQKGKSIGSLIPSDFEIAITKEKGGYKVYSCFENQFTITSIK